MHRFLALALASLALACSPGMSMRTDAGRDAAPLPDAWAPDVGHDAAPFDAGSDAGRDAGPDVGPPQDAGPWFDPECVLEAMTGAPDGSFPIPMDTSTSGGVTFVFCPTSNPSASPPICTGENRWSTATLTETLATTHVTLTGTLPFRVADVPTTVGLGVCSPMITLAIDGDGSCPGVGLDALPISITLTFDPTRANALQLETVLDDAVVTSHLASATQQCGIAACSGTCCSVNACQCALASTDLAMVRNALATVTHAALQTSLTAQVEARLCARNAMGPCPSGTTPDFAGICRYASDDACAPAPALFTFTHCGP